MLLILFAVAALFVIGIETQEESCNCLSVEQTTSIKGLFAFIIFCSHIKQYVVLSSACDMLYGQILSIIGQLMVAPFFFYSGFGIAYGIENKSHYMTGFFPKRILRTWFKFAFAVLIFCFVDFCVGDRYSVTQVVLSFIGWDSIGNSNWFVFDTLLLYLGVFVSYVALSKTSNKKHIMVTLVTLYTVLMIIMLRLFKESWWYDTLLAFPCGFAFLYVKRSIFEAWKHGVAYWISGIVMLLCFAICYLVGGAASILCPPLFCLLIVWFTHKVKVSNRVLSWSGVHSFYIYIYMRIPMLILSKLQLNKHALLFSVSCLGLTMALAFYMKKITEKAEKILFN